MLFSGTEDIVAAIAAFDLLDPDAKVRRYWPEFTPGVRVYHVLAHTAAPLYVDGEYDLLDNQVCADLLARQAPLWPPGTRVAYHALTYGYLVAELLRRTTERSWRRAGQLDLSFVTNELRAENPAAGPTAPRRALRLGRSAGRSARARRGRG